MAPPLSVSKICISTAPPLTKNAKYHRPGVLELGDWVQIPDDKGQTAKWIPVKEYLIGYKASGCSSEQQYDSLGKTKIKTDENGQKWAYITIRVFEGKPGEEKEVDKEVRVSLDVLKHLKQERQEEISARLEFLGKKFVSEVCQGFPTLEKCLNWHKDPNSRYYMMKQLFGPKDR